MSIQSWQETLVSATADSTALTASVTATTILVPMAVFTLPANFFHVGRQIRITAAGRVSNVVTDPGTLTLDIRFGAVIAANGGPMAINIVAKANVPWVLEWLLTCRSVGSGTTATMMHQGQWGSESVIASPLPGAGGHGTHVLPNATPAVGTGFDSTIAQAVNLFGTWSLNNANSILTHQYRLESLN